MVTKIKEKIIKNQRQKQSYETMEPSKKRMLLEKKQVRVTAKKQQIQEKRAEKYKTMDIAKKRAIK